MKKILWLTSWYPNKRDRFSGDFIKRHAESTSLFINIEVIYVSKSPELSLEDGTRIVDNKKTLNLEEHIIYYKNRKGWISKLSSLITYFRIHINFIDQLRKKHELPDLIHVHVAMNAGMIALYLKWILKIPYVLTEHWTGYYQSAENSLFQKSFIKRYLTKLIIRHSSKFIPVSNALGEQIRSYWEKKDFIKIPNAVNTRIIFPGEEEKQSGFRFIHISSLISQKNPEGMIRAFAFLLKEGIDAELVLVGHVNKKLEAFIKDVAIPDNRLKCVGEVSYEQVGIELRNSDALLLFSFYENMPCVILEALCTGIPVIASRVGGVHEILHPENGILVDSGNETQLIKAMKNMISNYMNYDREAISQRAIELYSYETIGKEIAQVYQDVLI